MAGIYIEEMDHLMELSPTTEVKTYDDESAMNDRIYEWLETPQGTVADLPSWGHNLGPFKFEPPGETLNVMAEMAIMTKMPQDIENLAILGINIEFVEIDCCKIVIRHRLGVFESTVTL